MAAFQHVTFTSEDQATNIGLRHVQTLQEAAGLSHNDILFIGEHKPEPVNLFINMDEEKAVIEYQRPELQKYNFSVRLKDYSYLLNTLILS